MFLYFQTKLYEQRKQLLLISNHRPHYFNRNIIIKYIKPSITHAFTKEVCSLNLAPIDIPLVVCRLSRNSSIYLISEAEVNGIIWYEVSLPAAENINNRGWIKAEQVLFREIMK